MGATAQARGAFQEPLNAEAAPEAERERDPSFLWVVGPPIVGALAGAVLPLAGGAASEPAPWGRVSGILGWAYFCAWSVSFYPQVVQNCRRRSVVGLSLDYQILNAAGFVCYFMFNAALYWDPTVQQEYRDAHGGRSSAVRLNDVVFAGHAALLTLVTLLQIVVFYDYPPLQRADKLLRGLVLAFVSVVLFGFAGLGCSIAGSDEGSVTWLSLFVVMSEVKVVISVVKYCPQVWMNYRRKSTEGWNIANVLLDFTGGLLSVAQLLVDAAPTGDWSAVSGDPAHSITHHLCKRMRGLLLGG